MGIMYSANENRDMYFMLDQCNCNALQTAREYALRSPSLHIPDIKNIHRLNYRLTNIGNVNPIHNIHYVGERMHGGLKLAQEGAILWQMEETLKMRTRALSLELNESSSIVHMLLQSEGLYTFRYTTMQDLHPDVFQRCIDFCESLLQQL